MIDLHSHLVYGVDDGVKNLEESILMIKAAYDNGYRYLITTPHYIEDSIYSSPFIKNKAIIELIQNELSLNNIDVKLLLGNEVMFTNNILELLDSGEIAKLNNSRYLLIELPESIVIDTLVDKIDSLINKGIVPVIAHPERYDYIEIDILKTLVNHGALLQMNLGSILGKYGKKVKKRSQKLLKQRLIHVVGSDTHGKDNFCYQVEARKVVNKIDPIMVELIFNINPGKIVNNDEI